MFRFKYLLVMLCAAVLAGVVIVACSDDDSPNPKDEGIKAGNEMCGCVSSYDAPNPSDYTDPLEYQAAFMAYAGQLYECIGVIAKYEKYVTPDLDAYDEQSAEPLLSVFNFKDNDFKNGFREGVSSCADAFNALWALFQ